MGVRLSFCQAYFSYMRSVTHGGTGIGVKMPIENGWQPLSPEASAKAAPAISTIVLAFCIPHSLPSVAGKPNPSWPGFAA
jgi:hypothetical protein